MNNKLPTILLAGGLLILAGAAFYIGSRLSNPNNVTPDDSSAAATCPSNLDSQVSLDGIGNWQSGNVQATIGQTVCVRAVPGTGTTISVINPAGLVGKECTASPDGTVKCANTTDGICFKFSSYYDGQATVRAMGYVSDAKWYDPIPGCIVNRKITEIAAVPTETPTPTSNVPTPTLAPGQTAAPTSIPTPIVTILPRTGITDGPIGKYILGIMLVILGLTAYKISKEKRA